MKKYIKDYISSVDEKLNNKITINDLDELLTKINFFSHERLVHLLVTLFFGIFTIIFLILSYKHIYFGIITIIMGILLTFYIFHYFFLENSVQYLYRVYDKMKTKL